MIVLFDIVDLWWKVECVCVINVNWIIPNEQSLWVYVLSSIRMCFPSIWTDISQTIKYLFVKPYTSFPCHSIDPARLQPFLNTFRDASTGAVEFNLRFKTATISIFGPKHIKIVFSPIRPFIIYSWTRTRNVKQKI